MGYYVQIVKSTLRIPAMNKDLVLATWKAMNLPKYDHLKQGGSYGKESSWYSFMSPTYDAECNSCEDVLDQLGFAYDHSADGDILIVGYDSKMGQEELFFKAVEHYVRGSVTWVGDDGDIFKWTLNPVRDFLDNCQNLERLTFG